jgi:pimeloyl-ACP methyl ester carboxylesterase
MSASPNHPAPSRPRPPDPEIQAVYPELAKALSDAGLNGDGARTLAVGVLVERLKAAGHSPAAIEWALHLGCDRGLLQGTVLKEKQVKTIRPGISEAKARLVNVEAISATQALWDAWKSGSFTPRQKEVILLIHGIRTFAEWQPMVKRVLQEIPGTEVVAIKSGYFNLLAFWCPVLTRQATINDVRREIQNAKAANPNARFSVIAHSYGTYAISKILLENPDLRLHRLVLCGSIVPRKYRWDYARARLDTDVINDYGTRDIWPVVAQCLSWGYGDTGRHGFGRGAMVRDRGHDYKHSDFFNEKFVRDYWKPWVEENRFQPSDWEEKVPPSPWWLSILSVLPLRWVIVAISVLAITWFVWFVRGRFYGSQSIQTTGVPETVGSSEIKDSNAVKREQNSAIASVGEIPTEQLMRVVNDENEDMAVRAAGLGRLINTKTLPDRTVLSLVKVIFETWPNVEDPSDKANGRLQAAESLIHSACLELVPRRENLHYVLTEFSQANSNAERFLKEIQLERESGVAINLLASKDKQLGYFSRLARLWSSLCREAFLTRGWNEFSVLNDVAFLSEHAKSMSRVIAYPGPQKIREMLNSDNRGIKFFGGIHALNEEQFREEVVLLKEASSAVRAILLAPGETNADYELAAKAFQIIPGNREFSITALKLILDDEGFRRRMEITHLPGRHERGMYDRFYAAADYLRTWCRFEMYATEIEPLLRVFIQHQAEELRKSQGHEAKRGNGDDRTRACLDILFEMNSATPQDKRILIQDPRAYGGHRVPSDIERRLQASTIQAVDSLFAKEDAILDRVNLMHQKDRWLELKGAVAKK